MRRVAKSSPAGGHCPATPGQASPKLRARNSRIAHNFGEWRADHHVQPARIETQLRAASQLVGDAALDELDAETLLVVRVRGRTAAFLPFQHEALGILLPV